MTCSAMWTMGLMTVTTPVKLSSPSFWRNTNQTQCLRQKFTAHITVSSRFRSCALHVLCCWHRSLRDQIVAYLHLRIAFTSVAGKQCVSPKIQYGLHNPTIVQYWKNLHSGRCDKRHSNVVLWREVEKITQVTMISLSYTASGGLKPYIHDDKHLWREHSTMVLNRITSGESPPTINVLK